MHEFPSLTCVLCCSYLPLLLVSLSLLCVCLSHPSRAIHLYLSETSIEIDSSDGMISDPSTPDSSSSEEEEPSSDDDDDNDDSDWGGGNRQRDRNSDMMPVRKFAGLMPEWHTWIPQFIIWVETRWWGRCCSDGKQAHRLRMGGKWKESSVWEIPNKNKDVSEAFDEGYERGSEGKVL